MPSWRDVAALTFEDLQHKRYTRSAAPEVIKRLMWQFIEEMRERAVAGSSQVVFELPEIFKVFPVSELREWPDFADERCRVEFRPVDGHWRETVTGGGAWVQRTYEALYG